MTWKAAGSPGFVVQDTTTPTTFKMTTNDSSGFINTTTNHPIEIRTNNTASMTIGAAGDIDVERGDIFFSTAGKGICLGVTSNTDSNTLDDYEEGEYAPTVTCSNSGSYTLDSSYNNLSYTKIGRLVTIRGWIKITGESSPNGQLLISVPFTPVAMTDSANTGYDHSVVLTNHADSPSGETIVGWISEGEAWNGLYHMNQATGAVGSVFHTDVDTAFDIMVNMSFLAT